MVRWIIACVKKMVLFHVFVDVFGGNVVAQAVCVSEEQLCLWVLLLDIVIVEFVHAGFKILKPVERRFGHNFLKRLFVWIISTLIRFRTVSMVYQKWHCSSTWRSLSRKGSLPLSSSLCSKRCIQLTICSVETWWRDALLSLSSHEIRIVTNFDNVQPTFPSCRCWESTFHSVCLSIPSLFLAFDCIWWDHWF